MMDGRMARGGSTKFGITVVFCYYKHHGATAHSGIGELNGWIRLRLNLGLGLGLSVGLGLDYQKVR